MKSSDSFPAKLVKAVAGVLAFGAVFATSSFGSTSLSGGPADAEARGSDAALSDTSRLEIAATARRPGEFARFEGDLYFSAYERGETGHELWRYDGSEAELVADINPGRYGSKPRGLTVYDGALYFGADDGTTGRELWRYDGSDVELVKDINPDTTCRDSGCSSKPQELVVYDNVLYFEADDGKTGNELWSFDGTSVQQVADINSSTSCGPVEDGEAVNCAAHIYDVIVYKDRLYFNADNGESGKELYSYDGSQVKLVAEIAPDDGMYPHDFHIFKNELYFSASSSETETVLWRYDGSTPERVTAPNAPECSADSGGTVPCFPGPGTFVNMQGNFYFSDAGDRVWEYDGQNFTQVELETKVDSTFLLADDMTTYNDVAYYRGSVDEDEVYKQLFAFDGSAVRKITHKLQELEEPVPGHPKISAMFRGDVRDLTVYDGALYFRAQNMTTRQSYLWRYRE